MICGRPCFLLFSDMLSVYVRVLLHELYEPLYCRHLVVVAQPHHIHLVVEHRVRSEEHTSELQSQ